MRTFYVRVVVHGEIPAEDAGTAIELLSERIREGIGPDTGEREWGISVAAGSAARDQGARPEIMLVNEAFMSHEETPLDPDVSGQ